MERGSYIVKTLENEEELEQAFRMRHDIFHTEHHGRVLPDAMDADELDLVCDHLGIMEKESGTLVGVYRVTSSAWSEIFYAKRKFQLAGLLALPGTKLELGRACIRRRFRDGITLQLLWRGILEYARLSSINYLFGSASIRQTDARRISLIYSYCRYFGQVTDEYPVTVAPEHSFPGLELTTPAEVEKSLGHIRKWIPPLFRSYLKMGARIATVPAFDPFMSCADFLMVQPTCRLRGRWLARDKD